MSNDSRKAVRADSNLPPAARLLFEEIWEMHHASEEGCYADNEYLGNQIGAAPSSVRRYRRRLREEGYLKERRTDGRRYLIPADAVSFDRNDQNRPVSTDQNGQNCTKSAVNSDQDRDKNNPEGTREAAPAHEGPVEERFGRLVHIWRNTSGTPPLQERHEKTFLRWADDAIVTDFETFRQVLKREAESTSQREVNLNLGVLREEYEREVQSGILSPERQKDPDWSVIDGEPAYQGVKVSELGPQNYYEQETPAP